MGIFYPPSTMKSFSKKYTLKANILNTTLMKYAISMVYVIKVYSIKLYIGMHVRFN